MSEHIWPSHAHAWGSRLKAQDVHRSCVVLLRTQKTISPHSKFHRTLLGVNDIFSPFCSSLPQTTPTSRPLTGTRSTPCATSLEGRQSGYLAEPLPHIGGGARMKRVENEEVWLKMCHVEWIIMEHGEGLSGREASGVGCCSGHRAQTERSRQLIMNGLRTQGTVMKLPQQTHAAQLR